MNAHAVPEPGGRIRLRDINLRRWVAARPWLVLCVCTLLLLIQIRNWWEVSPDSTQYLSMARSLASGDGLLRFGSPHVLYQPGYAFLLAPFFLISPEPFLLLSVFHVLLAAGTLLLMWRWSSQIVGRASALFVVLFATCTFVFIAGTRRYLAELPTMLLLLGISMLCGRLLRPRLTWAAGAGLVLLLVPLVLGASMVRYACFAIVPGFAFAGLMLCRRRRIPLRRSLAISLLIGVPAITCILLWIATDNARALGSHESSNVHYLASSSSTLLELCDHLRVRIGVVSRIILPGLTSTYADSWLNPFTLLVVPVFALLIIGWWKLLRRTGDVLLASAPFYFAVYVLWPDDGRVRFLAPLLPVLVISAWRVLSRLRAIRFQLFLGLAALHLVFAMFYQVQSELSEGATYRENWPALHALLPEMMPHRENIAIRGLSRAERPQAGTWLSVKDTAWHLSYLLDRRPTIIPEGSDIPAAVEAVLLPPRAVAPWGFHLSKRAGEICLFVRGTDNNKETLPTLEH